MRAPARRLVLQGHYLDLEAPSEVVPAGFGLVLAAPVGPVQCVVDGVFCLVAGIEQASDLSNGERDLATAGLGRRVLSGRLRRVGYC